MSLKSTPDTTPSVLRPFRRLPSSPSPKLLRPLSPPRALRELSATDTGAAPISRTLTECLKALPAPPLLMSKARGDENAVGAGGRTRAKGEAKEGGGGVLERS
jgi:hypothetical protein